MDRAFKIVVMVEVAVIALSAAAAVLVFASRSHSPEVVADTDQAQVDSTPAPNYPHKGDDVLYHDKVGQYFPDDDGVGTGGVQAASAAQSFCSTTSQGGASSAIAELRADENLSGGETALRETAYWSVQVYCPQFEQDVAVALG